MCNRINAYMSEKMLKQMEDVCNDKDYPDMKNASLAFKEINRTYKEFIRFYKNRMADSICTQGDQLLSLIEKHLDTLNDEEKHIVMIMRKNVWMALWSSNFTETLNFIDNMRRMAEIRAKIKEINNHKKMKKEMIKKRKGIEG